MFFKQIQNKMFSSGFFISDNRIFAIGIVDLTIQILSKVNAHWAIIKEYKTMDENMKREWLAKILKLLEPVTTNDSDIIKKALPEMKDKQHYVFNVNAKEITSGTIDANEITFNKNKQYEPKQKSTYKSKKGIRARFRKEESRKEGEEDV